ncbi:MAG: hypothetical protein GY679_01890 [Mycoplasma sp.]|nr:hypothetical protein [Mycoplasma sp.]
MNEYNKKLKKEINKVSKQELRKLLFKLLKKKTKLKKFDVPDFKNLTFSYEMKGGGASLCHAIINELCSQCVDQLPDGWLEHGPTIFVNTIQFGKIGRIFDYDKKYRISTSFGKIKVIKNEEIEQDRLILTNMGLKHEQRAYCMIEDLRTTNQ